MATNADGVLRARHLVVRPTAGNRTVLIQWISSIPITRVLRMIDKPIRASKEIRRTCTLKLRSVKTSNMFLAILAALLEEDWTTPNITELRITRDHRLLGRSVGEMRLQSVSLCRGRFDPQYPRDCGRRRTRWGRTRLSARESGRDQCPELSQRRRGSSGIQVRHIRRWDRTKSGGDRTTGRDRTIGFISRNVVRVSSAVC